MHVDRQTQWGISSVVREESGRVVEGAGAEEVDGARLAALVHLRSHEHTVPLHDAGGYSLAKVVWATQGRPKAQESRTVQV